MSTPEANKNILEVKDLTERFMKIAPEEWKELETSPSELVTLETETGEVNGKVKAFMKRCAGPEPTDEDIQELFNAIEKDGRPVCWLLRLGCLEVVDFPEGQDPTVDDFFAGNFDSSLVTKKLVLVSYPHLETK